MKLLCIEADEESEKLQISFKAKLDYVNKSIIRQVNLFVDAVI
jgi:hypothetical protein